MCLKGKGDRMRIVLCVVSVAFGGLSLVAALSQIKKGKQSNSHVLMALGSVVLIAAVICNIVRLGFDWSLALAGSAMICAAAVWNGKRSGSFHIQHHVVRILISLLLVAGFVWC